MRVGYEDFVLPEAVDILIPPPAAVRYEPVSQPRRELTTSGLAELRRYSSLEDIIIHLEWRDIPERDVSVLSLIPPSEILTWYAEDGQRRRVVINEPIRALLSGVITRDGQPLYSTSLELHPVTVSQRAYRDNLKQATTLKTLGATKPPVLLGRDEPLPAAPTPQDSPVRSRATGGLPPGVSVGDGSRFTFDGFQDSLLSARYFSVDADSRFELTEPAPQDYQGWYSSTGDGGQLKVGVLGGLEFDISDLDWALGILLYRGETGTQQGSVLRAESGQWRLSLNHGFAPSLSLQGPTGRWWWGGSSYTAQTPGEYFRNLILIMDNGNPSLHVDGQEETLNFVASGGQIQDVPPLVRLGGGYTFVDDLWLCRHGALDAVEIHDWMLGNG